MRAIIKHVARAAVRAAGPKQDKLGSKLRRRNAEAALHRLLRPPVMTVYPSLVFSNVSGLEAEGREQGQKPSARGGVPEVARVDPVLTSRGPVVSAASTSRQLTHCVAPASRQAVCAYGPRDHVPPHVMSLANGMPAA
jgi:hypothetical protein